MFSGKINIFKICKEFINSNCDSSRLREDENTLKPFSAFLIKDENNNYMISDNEFSIKIILQEDSLKKVLSAHDNINLENLDCKNYI